MELIKSPVDFERGTGKVSIVVDPDGASIDMLKPDVVVDAIMAKVNLGTDKSMAPVVIGIGPGFTAPNDVHAVIETKRGHTLGRVIRD
ncbi:MAG: molybdenum hydroxylase, partial [Synergistaceae bacterium]|nr:molybdenum hydroxylase [Synergistaceae bacterium]